MLQGSLRTRFPDPTPTAGDHVPRIPRSLLPALRSIAAIAIAALMASGLALAVPTAASAEEVPATPSPTETAPPPAATTEAPVDAAAVSSIQGTVTVADGAGAAGVSVNAYRNNGGYSQYAAGVVTSDVGGYAIEGLEPGTYTLEFAPPFGSALIPEWWNDRPNQWSADSFDVADGAAVSGMDAQLALGGAVEGVVSGPGGVAVPYATVTAYAFDNGYPEYRGGASTDESGTFSITGLPQGTYSLQFSPPWGTAYSGEWWNDKPDQYSADRFGLAGGETVSGLLAELSLGGTITGVVTGADDAPLQGVNVSATGPGTWRSGVTGADGRYELTGLAAGDYTIAFQPDSFEPGSAAGYVREYWDDASSQYDADPVTVGAAALVTGIDAQLALGGGISGTVAADGEPLAGVRVSVNGPSWGSTTTDAVGHYELTGLAPGSYTAWFEMPSGSPYVHGSAVVDVSSGATATLDYTPERAASVRGRITNAESGAPVAEAEVTLYGFGDYPRATATTDVDGYYSISPVEAGRYLLEVTGEGIRTTWSGGSDTRAGATVVSVAAASETVVDVAAPAGASGVIAGTVSAVTRDGTGAAAGAVVELHTELGELRSTNADADGAYRFEGLEAGRYAVRFKQTEWSSRAWWWDGSMKDAAQFFDVGADGTVTRDVTLPGLGWISATIGVDGAFSGYIRTEVFDATTGELVASGSEVDWNGVHSVWDVPAGDVKVRFTGPIRDAWWGGGEDFASAQTLTVPVGGEARADASLSLDTVVTGVVSAPDGSPVPGASVLLRPDDGSAGTFYAVTDASGVYRVTGLEAGGYLVTAGGLMGSVGTHGPEVVEVGPEVAEVTHDIRLDQNVKLTGTITYLGQPVEGCLGVQPVGAQHGEGTCTDAGGSYEYWLQPGEYDLSFRTTADIGAAGSRQQLTIGPDQSGTVELDVDLESGGVIEGTITADLGNGIEPLAGVWVTAEGDESGAAAVSGPDGAYRIWGLPNGAAHTVRFGNVWNDLGTEWWDDAPSPATAITVQPGADPMTGVDALLTRGGAISGRVTDADGLGASFATVQVYSTGGAYIGETMANIQGAYALTGLAPGEVTLRFAPEAQRTPGHLPEWWQDAGSVGSATAVAVVAGKEASLDDAALNEVGTVAVELAVPAVTGTPRVGETLTATASSTTDGASLAYEWLADGVAIPGATESALVLAVEQVGTRISVRVTASAVGYLPTTTTSPASDVVAPAEPEPGMPQILGTPVVGAKLEVDPGEKPRGTAFEIQWYADGVPITDATDSTLRLSPAQEGAQLAVQVVTLRRGIVLERRDSDPTLRVLLADAPTVSGVQAVGSTLEADPGDWTDGTEHRYQWFADGTAIQGATRSALELTAELAGTRIGVSVTGSLLGYPTVERSSEVGPIVRP